MTGPGKEEGATVVRTETDLGIAWLVVPVPSATEGGPFWWSCCFGVCALAVYASPVIGITAVLMAMWVITLWMMMPAGPSGERVILDRHGVSVAVLTKTSQEPASALEGEVIDETWVTWDALLRVDVVDGRVALVRADGGGVKLPRFPSAATVEIVKRLQDHHRAFEAATVSREEAAEAMRRLDAVIARDRGA